MTTTTSGPARAGSRPLVALWVVCAVATGVLGWLLLAVSDWPQERAAGVVLLATALLGLVAAVLVRGGREAHRTSVGASAAFVVAGVAAAVVVVTGPAGAGDVLLVAGVPVLAGLVTGSLALRGRRR